MERQEASSCDQSTCGSCEDTNCSASTRGNNESETEFAERQKLQSRLCRIRHIVVVLSGKGGVGKSTVAVNLAVALKMLGKRVGLLDVDIHGPSIPTMLGLEGKTLQADGEDLIPFDLSGMKVMSLGFLLPNPDEAVIWRGPMKIGVIKQFLKDVEWGELDYLIIDCPPGTGDEPLSVCQFIGKCDGAVVVTTPQKVAAIDVRKSINFCKQLQLPVLGVVENMSGFVCPKCGEITPDPALRRWPANGRGYEDSISRFHTHGSADCRGVRQRAALCRSVRHITNSGIDAGHHPTNCRARSEGSRYPDTKLHNSHIGKGLEQSHENCYSTR